MPTIERISDGERARLAEAMVVANTAGSLLAWLEEQPVVQRLAEWCTEDELLDGLTKLLAVEDGSETRVGQAYALLVALILRRRARGAVGEMPINRHALRWARTMWDLADATGGKLISSASSVPTTPIRSGRSTLFDAQGGAMYISGEGARDA